MRCLLTLVALVFLLPAAAMAQNPRDKKVRDDKVKVEADGYGIPPQRTPIIAEQAGGSHNSRPASQPVLHALWKLYPPIQPSRSSTSPAK